VLQSDLRPLCPRAALAALLALCPDSTPGRSPSLAVRAFAQPSQATMPSADSCLPISGDPSSLSPVGPQAGLPGSVLVPSTPRRPIYQTPPQGVKDFVVACPLVPGVSRLLSGSCSSPRVFVPRFLQTSPRDDALALPFSFGLPCLERGLAPPSTKTCPAHTLRFSGGAERRPLQRLVRPGVESVNLQRLLAHYANIKRPLGFGIGRPSSCAVSIHSVIITWTLARAS
jgi:hypothetical protein